MMQIRTIDIKFLCFLEGRIIVQISKEYHLFEEMKL